MTTREGLEGTVRTILEQQLFAVLATQSGKIPYCNLVAFAATNDLAALLFVTKRETTKYTNALESRVAAMLIDDRPQNIEKINKAKAVTATGRIAEVTGVEKEYLAEVYNNKHPMLVDFVERKNSALMKISVERYIVADFNGAVTIVVKQQ